MTKDEALKLALEALEDLGMKHFENTGEVLYKETFNAIKEALAQPEQETQGYREATQLAKWLFKTHYAQQEHYASGRVIWGLCDTTSGVISQIDNMVCKLVLPKEPEQEPVAWVGLDLDNMAEAFHRVIEEHHSRKNPFHDPVNGDAMLALRELRGLVAYMKRNTTPLQRTWIGLTDDEISEVAVKSQDGISPHDDTLRFARAIESKLKEKNEFR